MSLLLAACQTPSDQSNRVAADYLIENGIVYDGSGAAPRVADIAVRRDRIVFIGDATDNQFAFADRIDASGLIVAPGFIDPHTHADNELVSSYPEQRQNKAFAFQGVTTVVVGNDGYGRTDILKLATKARQDGIGTNVAYLAGFGYIRKSVIGDDDRAPTEAESARMKNMMAQAMCEGAVGLSAGLYYTPQNFAKTAEVVELARIAGQQGGYYDTHLRDESSYNIGLIGAVDEAIEIGEQSGAAVHISHIKALGPAVWGQSSQIISLINAAREKGQKITADQYPWAASGTRISNALVPRWALDGGLAGLRERLKNAAMLDRIKSDMAGNLERRGGADKLLITGALGGAGIEPGQTLADLAVQSRSDPLDVAIDMLKTGDARVASFNMNAKDIRAFATQEWVVTGSDGSTGHPRKYASFPKAYRDFVVEGKILSLSRFIRRSSGQTADIVGVKDRGYLKVGMAADIVVFDSLSFAPMASYEQPRLLSTGVRYLFVNGQPAISGGQSTGALPGRPLLKETPC
ncbi:N-acyl-D-amino-acid deacylase family protein [Parasphingorhabdus sp.]|uniref:N-acyl-D-amino-acid deacylase family protein n=1 Tax=Parasphingorhabdus sp. TaxID=2709688 RepID=UPI003A8E43D9